MTEVTVIIPAYNCESYIEETLRSVMEQTERNIEIIVVDDGSTDNTPTILQSLALKDDRIKVCSRLNSGKPSIARNTGLRNAKGKFICFLDGDDLYHPEKIEKGLKVFSDYPEIDVVFHNVKFLTQHGDEMEGTYLGAAGFQSKAAAYLKDVGSRIYVARPEFYNFMSTTITGIHTSSVMIRKERLDRENIWFPEDLLIGEDIDLWFRMAKGNGVAYIDEILSYYRQHEQSITKNVEAALMGSILAHTRNYDRAQDLLSIKEKEAYRIRISKQYFYLGYLYFREGRKKKARNAYLHSIEWTFKAKCGVAYLKTFIPTQAIAAYRKIASRSFCSGILSGMDRK